MSDVRVATVTGRETAIPEVKFDAFKSNFLGSILRPDDPGYNEARALWNGMIDRRPSLIARCAGTADVISSVRLAREFELLAAIRGGGHNIAGMATADGAFVIDLSPMKWAHVNPIERTAWVGPGATLHALDHETQAFGLATPLGINSTTGVAGLTLGGGFGWLSRSLGLTVDNLVSADVITADGKLLKASEEENEDLFWAIRGGGGNFGVVTSFAYRLHPVGPQVLAGLIVHPFKDARKVFQHYRSFVAGAPDNLTCWVVMRKAPPLPFLPKEVHGREIFIIALMYNGDIKNGEKLLHGLRMFGEPIADVVSPMPFEAWQQAFDPLLAPGARNYWRSHNFTELTDDAIDTFIDYAGKLPTPLSEIFLGHLGGAVNRIPTNATAYPHRDANFVLNVHTRWEEKTQDEECVAWAREFSDVTATYATGGVYVNFISAGEDRVPSAFGGNYERLKQIKKKYDPDNFFRVNQNIKPVGATITAEGKR